MKHLSQRGEKCDKIEKRENLGIKKANSSLLLSLISFIRFFFSLNLFQLSLSLSLETVGLYSRVNSHGIEEGGE